MNTNIRRLLKIAEKDSRLIIGLMSGTSLDGLDIALCEISNHGIGTKVKLRNFKTVPYTVEIKNEIKKVFAKPLIDFQTLCLLNPWLAKIHASYILEAVAEWNYHPDEIDLIASHGQTVYHSPKILHQLPGFPNATLQIGDGDHIAVDTGIITISDFRQKHIAAGGEGAPLALYGDYCIFFKKDQNRILLNMGGIANFTFLSNSMTDPGVLVTDTGPGNTLIDAITQKYFALDYDHNATLTKQGAVNEQLLEALKNNDFFNKPFPRTTGPELFNVDYVLKAQNQTGTLFLSPFDLLATVTRFSADTIIDAIRSLIKKNEAYTIYISGGGAHNPLLVGQIRHGLPEVEIKFTDELGIPGDAKEAILFAILANETIMGDPLSWQGKIEIPSVTMGKISFPT